MAVVYVDVESQGRNEVKPSQTSPGGGHCWTIKSSGGRRDERKNPHHRETNTARVFGFCHLGCAVRCCAVQQIIQTEGQIIKQELEYSSEVKL